MKNSEKVIDYATKTLAENLSILRIDYSLEVGRAMLFLTSVGDCSMEEFRRSNNTYLSDLGTKAELTRGKRPDFRHLEQCQELVFRMIKKEDREGLKEINKYADHLGERGLRIRGRN